MTWMCFTCCPSEVLQLFITEVVGNNTTLHLREVLRTSKLLEFKEFNETIILFTLVRYETGYSQLDATRLLGYLPPHMISHPTRARGIIVKA